MDGYDDYFKASTAEFWPQGFDWLWFKAQAIAESKLNHLALSPCGAMGLMQIMPATWQELSKQIGVKDPWCPQSSIRAGISYMRQMRNYWQARCAEGELNALKLAQASYNAGIGNVRRAWRLSLRDSWLEILKALPQITGQQNARQTSDYVRKIQELYDGLRTGSIQRSPGDPSDPSDPSDSSDSSVARRR